MTYHDTPSQPMPEMRYVDASAKTGREAHLLDHHREQRGVEVGAFRAITVRSISLIRFYTDCREPALRQEVPSPRGRIL